MTKPAAPEQEITSPPYQRRKMYIVLRSQEAGQATVPDSGDDFITPIKETLGRHVVESTRTAGNAIPITDVQKTYLDTFHEAGPNASRAVREFDSASNSGMFGEFKVRKEQGDTSKPTGTEVLRNLDEHGDASDHTKRVQRVLVDNGSYNQEHPFVTSNTRDSSLKLGSVSFRVPGEHGPRKFPTSVAEQPQLTIGDMKKVAMMTMLGATGELTRHNPSDDSGLGILRASAPGLSRVGIRVNASRFSAKEAIKAIRPDIAQSPESTSFLDPKSVMSYGSVNNPFVPFDGLTNVPSILSATIMTATVAGLLKTLSLIRLARTGTGRVRVLPNGSPDNRQQWMGSYKRKPAPGFLSSLGRTLFEFVDTDNEFFKCVDRGITEFFNLGSVGGAAGNVARLHGYYNVVLRNVIRSVNELVSPVVETATAHRPDAGDIVRSADPFTLAQRLNSSALIKFINILATIGDKSLKATGDSPELLGGALGDTDIHLSPSEIDRINDTVTVQHGTTEKTVLNLAVLQSKNRLSDGRLSMGNSTVRSLLLIPDNLKVAASVLQRTANMDNVEAGLSNDNFIENTTENGRIRSSVVEQIENYLENDYMPFYFHDIRTNEILSFHAFLGDISETINADYNETEGYGRVGSVLVYKNTKREIKLSFKVLASNSSDFDQMWYKINRLAMMLYPQWTEGRRISYGTTGKFIQPFSQLPGASPLIRLRLGDLWKTNYSKFAVARLFGVANGLGSGGAFQVRNTQTEATRVMEEMRANQAFTERAQAVFRSQRAGVFAVSDPTSNRDLTLAKSKVRLLPRNPGYPKVGGVRGTLLANTEQDVEVVGIQDGNLYKVRPLSPPPTASRRRNGTSTPAVDPGPQEYLVPADHLLATMSYILEALRGTGTPPTSQSATNTETGTQQDINSFFDSQQNPIVKAFESTQGKGIAGFIKSMSLGYQEATWVTDKANGRAPMLVSIDMDFAPVHDIQPGLDSNGSMTAPLWNVGDIMGNMTDAGALQSSINSLRNARGKLI